jgi:hypothetical protein
MYYVCMYVRIIYVCLHVCMYICMYVCVYVFVYVCMCVLCMYVCMYACMNVCMYVCLYVCMYVRTYVYMYVRIMYVCMYVCRLILRTNSNCFFEVVIVFLILFCWNSIMKSLFINTATGLRSHLFGNEDTCNICSNCTKVQKRGNNFSRMCHVFYAVCMERRI